MLKYLGNNDWYYITDSLMYYIVTGDLGYYVYSMAEGLKELCKAKNIVDAVNKINEEEN